MKQYFIYLTTNIINGKKYIGKHYGELDDSYLGSGTALLRAIEKYGKQAFKRDILFISKNEKENNIKEKEFIKIFNAVEDENFYNIAEGGDGGNIFKTLPKERQEQLKERARQQCSGSGNPMYGKHHSEETKEKLRKIDKSYTQTEEYRQNMSLIKMGKLNGMYGRQHSEESKEKMSLAKKGKYMGKENGNAKGISAYKDENYTILVKHFDTIQEALLFVGTNPKDYSGLTKRMKINKPYKNYYWKKDSVETNIEEKR